MTNIINIPGSRFTSSPGPMVEAYIEACVDYRQALTVGDRDAGRRYLAAANAISAAYPEAAAEANRRVGIGPDAGIGEPS
jgi:hypothetical protein